MYFTTIKKNKDFTYYPTGKKYIMFKINHSMILGDRHDQYSLLNFIKYQIINGSLGRM